MRSVFGDAVDTARVRLVEGKWWPFQPSASAMAPMGSIYFHPDGGGWSEDFSRESLGGKAFFIHEMTHVWQSQRGGRFYLPLMRHPFCRYSYAAPAGQAVRTLRHRAAGRDREGRVSCRTRWAPIDLSARGPAAIREGGMTEHVVVIGAGVFGAWTANAPAASGPSRDLDRRRRARALPRLLRRGIAIDPRRLRIGFDLQPDGARQPSRMESAERVSGLPILHPCGILFFFPTEQPYVMRHHRGASVARPADRGSGPRRDGPTLSNDRFRGGRESGYSSPISAS